MYRRNFSEEIIPIAWIKWILSTFKENPRFPFFRSKVTGLYITVSKICANQFFQQVQQVDLETRYATLCYHMLKFTICPQVHFHSLSSLTK